MYIGCFYAHLDGTLGNGLFVLCHDLHRSHATNDETKKNEGAITATRGQSSQQSWLRVLPRKIIDAVHHGTVN